MHVGAGLDELGGEPQRLRRRVRVLEAAGVGDERRRRAPRRSRGVSATSSSRSRSRTISAVDEASATTRLTAPKRVLSWWWSTSTTSAGCVEQRRAPGRCRRSFAQSTREQHALRQVGGQLAQHLAERHEAVLGREAAPSPARYITTSLPSARSAERRAEHRSERVAVGVLVRDDEEAVVRPERVHDGVEGQSACVVSVIVRVRLGKRLPARARRSASSCARRARPTDRIRRPAAASASG